MPHDPERPGRGRPQPDPVRASASEPQANNQPSPDELVRALGAHESSIDTALEHLLARRAASRFDPDDERMAAFHEWRARAARDAQSPEERADTERSAQAFAERVLRRNAVTRSLARAGVRRVDAAPTFIADQGHSSDVAAAPVYDTAVAAGVGRELSEQPSTEWIRLPEDLAGSAYVALRVTGDSMEPLLHTGDTILVQLGLDVTPGRIVVARHPTDGYVVKRVARLGRDGIELASLNDAYAPFTIPPDTSLVLGTVILRWCPHAG